MRDLVDEYEATGGEPNLTGARARLEVPQAFQEWAATLPATARSRLSIHDLRLIWEPIERLEAKHLNAIEKLSNVYECTTARMTGVPTMEAHTDGEYMLYTDHQRVVAELREERETECLRLAACGVAARGGTTEGMDAAYVSDSLDAVLALWRRAETAEARVAALEAAVREAPHASGCNCVLGLDPDTYEPVSVSASEPCDCWKSRALRGEG